MTAKTEVVAVLVAEGAHNLDSRRGLEVEELADSMTEQVVEAPEDMQIAQDEEPADRVVPLGTDIVEGVGLALELGCLNYFLEPTSRVA